MNCRICASDDVAIFTVKEMVLGYRDEFTYGHCKNCGCIQIEQIPTNLVHYYPVDYYSLHGDFNAIPMNKIVAKLIKLRDLYFFQIDNNLIGMLLNKIYPSYIEGANLAYQFVYNQYKLDRNISIHDAGCGRGKFLNYFHQLGFKNLSGSDPFLEKEIINGDLMIYNKNLDEVEGEFDVIVLNHVFEHVLNPIEYLQVVNSKLKSKGKCLVRMPVANSLGFEMYGSNWVGLEAPRHLHVFSTDGFRNLAESNGFEVLDIQFDAVDWHYMVSEIYQKNVSQSEFDERTITSSLKKEYNLLASKANDLKKGDSCAYYLQKK